MLLDKSSYFAVAPEKETSILSAISLKRKKLHTTKTFAVFEEFVGGINAVNIMWSKSLNSSLLKRLLSF